MIDWDNIDTVLLDMDGTLLDLAFDNWFWQRHVPEQYALSRGLDYAEAERILHDWIESHLGTLNWYCLDFWTRELGLNISALKRAAADRIAVRPGAIDLKAKKLPGSIGVTLPVVGPLRIDLAVSVNKVAWSEGLVDSTRIEALSNFRVECGTCLIQGKRQG